MGFLSIVSLILLIAKICGLITISWFLVFLPFGISVMVYILILIVAVIASVFD